MLTLTPVSVHGFGYGSSSVLPLAMTPPSSHELAVALSESRSVTFVMGSAALRWLKIPSLIAFWNVSRDPRTRTS